MSSEDEDGIPEDRILVTEFFNVKRSFLKPKPLTEISSHRTPPTSTPMQSRFALLAKNMLPSDELLSPIFGLKTVEKLNTRSTKSSPTKSSAASSAWETIEMKTKESVSAPPSKVTVRKRKPQFQDYRSPEPEQSDDSDALFPLSASEKANVPKGLSKPPPRAENSRQALIEDWSSDNEPQVRKEKPALQKSRLSINNLDVVEVDKILSGEFSFADEETVSDPEPPPAKIKKTSKSSNTLELPSFAEITMAKLSKPVEAARSSPRKSPSKKKQTAAVKKAEKTARLTKSKPSKKAIKETDEAHNVQDTQDSSNNHKKKSATFPTQKRNKSFRLREPNPRGVDDSKIQAPKKSLGAKRPRISKIPTKIPRGEGTRKSSRAKVGQVNFWEQRLNYIYENGVPTLDSKQPIKEEREHVPNRRSNSSHEKSTASKTDARRLKRVTSPKHPKPSPKKASEGANFVNAILTEKHKLKELSQELFVAKNDAGCEFILRIKPGKHQSCSFGKDMQLIGVSGKGKIKVGMDAAADQSFMSVGPGVKVKIINLSKTKDFIVYAVEIPDSL